MNGKRASTFAAMMLIGVSLQGCIAAAIPLVAGGVVARGELEDKDSKPATATVVEPETTNPVDVADAPEQAPQVAQLPEAAPAPAPTSFTKVQSPQFTEFVRYSARMAFRHREGSEPFPSAVLRKPSALDGERIDCEAGSAGSERAPAVLIDMDPGDKAFGEGSPLPASPEAALSLKVLRSEGVTIAWLSENSAATADIVRLALVESGLDPEGEDTLLMMRYPDDRKQTRRKEFAAETCLIAMAGDRRRDFDELYEHLTNRNAALELETLINNGWFLIGAEIPPLNPALSQSAPTAEAEGVVDDDTEEPTPTQEGQEQ